MRVAFEIVQPEGGHQPIANVPMNTGLPNEKDQIILRKNDGSSAAFVVGTRIWEIEENEDGGGMSIVVRVVLHQVAVLTNARSSEEEHEPEETPAQRIARQHGVEKQ